MNTFTRAAIVATLAAAGAVALPAAANAATIYPPSDACQVTPATTTPGGTVQFSCDNGTFAPNESVTVTVTGDNGSNTQIGFVKLAVSTGSATSTSGASGELASTAIKLPSNASGVYNIAALSATSAGGTASVTVTSTGKAGAALPTTGGDGRTVALWTGGGLALLAGGAVAVGATARRRKRA